MTSDRHELLGGLSSLLWRERQLLELLLFKLTEEQLVLRAGDDRWLARATREVELVVDQLQLAELGREVEVVGVCRELGLGDGLTLRTLVDVVEEPWSEIFTKHREAFLELTREITDTAAANRTLVQRAQAATRATLDWLDGRGEATGGYTATGRAAPTTTRATLHDWAV